MTTTRIRRRVPRKTGFLAAIVATLLVGSNAFAFHVGDAILELDGNIADNGVAVVGNTDWAALFDSNGDPTGLPATTLDTTGVVQDFVPGASGPDDSYHEPSNKDNQPIDADGGSSVWGCRQVANATDKDDILNAYALASVGTGEDAGDLILHFGTERFDNSGTAFLGIWFFQADVTCDLASNKFTGKKTNNDILALVNFSNGGANISIQAFAWHPAATNPDSNAGSFTLIGQGVNCSTTSDNNGSIGGGGGAVDMCAEVNVTNNVVTPWPTEDKDKPGPDPVNTLEPAEFVEGGINLTDAFAAAGQTAPACFGSFMAETRSSDTLSATLKDFALGDLDTCDVTVVTTPSATTRELGSSDPITDTAVVSGTAPSGTPPSPTGTVSFFLCGPGVTGCGEGQGAPVPSDPAAAVTLGACDPVVAGASCATSADASGLITGIGTYCFRAVYDPGSDPFYSGKGGSFDGPEECFTVTDVSQIVTNQDWLPNDSATVTTGGSAVSGTVVFSLYENGTCSGTPVATFTDSTPADGFTTDNDEVYTSDQTVSWSATFTSDNGVGGSTSSCEVSSVTIDNNH